MRPEILLKPQSLKSKIVADDILKFILHVFIFFLREN